MTTPAAPKYRTDARACSCLASGTGGHADIGGQLRMTDFRLLRPGGFYHALARYGPDLWTPFTYAGLHATERSLRRKVQLTTSGCPL